MMRTGRAKAAVSVLLAVCGTVLFVLAVAAAAVKNAGSCMADPLPY